MSTVEAAAKECVSAFRRTGRLDGLAGTDCVVQLAHPFETLDVAEYHGVVDQLATAFPDLERRVTIELAGRDGHGQMWVGQCGYWCGAFEAPFLDIPPTRRMAAMRFHDFLRVEGGRVLEVQSLWDLPELMMQAGVWPLSPSLGREWQVPGPATQDGLRVAGDGAEALRIVGDMLAGLGNDPAGTPREVMARYWHEGCSWYGPSGIGTARGIDGFRKHHQAPFLGAMPDRQGFVERGHFFGQGDYVGFTAWPGMAMTLSGGTWLGIPGAGQEITMRSLDFWRVDAGRIAENWVLVDLLHVYAQLGVDVLARMREVAG
ncbi:ester cyclase [Rhodobacteraceae bacterium N5(2021)]|uniref:Ester cyclase n=1 Tax=Gymnodinialimonas phycosphaerae TaxID=2841589 RepID=A0A975TU77_9RHOB|nr:ester cyclase [Gymnodinialimonas phycosphaerae]MBY4895146.1 ester cyclase [Gymnodinialimonas phycosphaerae]